MNIKAGDTVEYIDVGTVMHGKRPVKIKVPKQGVWDGTKVVLNDKEQTTVYNLNWLTKAYTKAELITIIDDLYTIYDDANTLESYIKENREELLYIINLKEKI